MLKRVIKRELLNGKTTFRTSINIHNIIILRFNILKNRKDIKPDIFSINSVIKAHANTRDKKGALKYFKLIDDYNLTPDLITMNAMIHVCGQVGDHQLAEKFYDMMLIIGITPDLFTMNSMISGIIITIILLSSLYDYYL